MDPTTKILVINTITALGSALIVAITSIIITVFGNSFLRKRESKKIKREKLERAILLLIELPNWANDTVSDVLFGAGINALSKTGAIGPESMMTQARASAENIRKNIDSEFAILLNLYFKEILPKFNELFFAIDRFKRHRNRIALVLLRSQNQNAFKAQKLLRKDVDLILKLVRDLCITLPKTHLFGEADNFHSDFGKIPHFTFVPPPF